MARDENNLKNFVVFFVYGMRSTYGEEFDVFEIFGGARDWVQVVVNHFYSNFA